MDRLLHDSSVTLYNFILDKSATSARTTVYSNNLSYAIEDDGMGTREEQLITDRKIEEDNNYGHTISSIAISNQLQKMIHILKNMRVRDTEKYMQLVIG